jgi:hypothetical protein
LRAAFIVSRDGSGSIGDGTLDEEACSFGVDVACGASPTEFSGDGVADERAEEVLISLLEELGVGVGSELSSNPANGPWSKAPTTEAVDVSTSTSVDRRRGNVIP